MSNVSFLLLSVVFVWLIQLCFSYIQIKRFHTTIFDLRKRGVQTAVGMSGNYLKRRVYAVLVVDASQLIVEARYLSGWTVFASLKPVDAFKGQSVHTIGESPMFGISAKMWKAFRNAAGYIIDGSNNTGKQKKRRLPKGYQIQ